MKHDSAAGTPTILFGAFDRHNFGDLLFPHIAAALLENDNLIFAGLAERDLRGYGGHRLRSLAQLAAKWGERAANIIHVGGEILTCDAWQAAVMLLPPEQVQDAIARLDSHPRERLEWAQEHLGIPDLAPYAVSRQRFPRAARVFYNGVGGIDLAQRDAALRNEVLAKLKAADAVSVRDELTLAQLSAAGVTAGLVPDPAAMVADLFGAKIRRRASQDAVAAMRSAFPQGYIAVQFSADFGDDATLAEIAAQFDRVACSCGYGVVFFCAGVAPWHDDPACYQRVATRMQTAAQIFSSLDLWDICALIAHSSAYCGSSLHGRIVAMAFALPRVNLLHPDQEGKATKQAAYAQTWEAADAPQVVGVTGIQQGIMAALAQDKTSLAAQAEHLSRLYRESFDVLRSKLA